MVNSAVRVMNRFLALIRPGGAAWPAQRLDRWASRRVLQAMIVRTNNFENVSWLGRQIWQFPIGAWVLQEAIGEMRPDLIVETGTHLGGSAYFFASLCDLLDHGRVMSLDVCPRGTIAHPRITYIRGSSTDPTVVTRVREEVQSIRGTKILFVLDSDHSAQHVLQELETYAPFVPVGSYIHVQDGAIDDLPCFKSGRPGPMVAVETFMRGHSQFVRDIELESRYVMTFHPYGWLKRVKPD